VNRSGPIATLLVLFALVSAPQVASAQSPGVRVDDLDGVPRITLEGSWAGSRYTILRADRGTFRPVTEANSLCTGDCFVVDPGALAGGTYQYRFDLLTPDGRLQRYGPFDVTIGAAAVGLSARVLPGVIRDRGTLRVVAGLAAGDRAHDPSQPTRLDAEVTLHDLRGARVRTLYRGTLDRLAFDVPFEARDGDGRALAPGIWFVRIRAGAHVSHSRVTVVR